VTKILTLRSVLIIIAIVLCACSAQADSLDEQKALDAAWQALEPNTSSQNRAHWDVVEVRQVAGREITESFQGDPASGCWIGPTPPPNGEIRASESYWYVHMKPRPATPAPNRSDPSPTAPPAIPEPFVRQALLLIDIRDGQVVARKLFCVIY
jgi:hypothetical protein